MVKIAVSLHSGPKINLERTIDRLAGTETDFLHIDVMDGHFVPEIDFGENLVEEISLQTPIPLDIHMMVENPERLVESYNFPTTEVIGIHAEATQHIHHALAAIKKINKKCEVIINPGTPVSAIDPILNFVDQVMVMSVDPGTSGAEFIDFTVKKIKLLDELRKKNDYHYLIEADGSIDDQNISKLIDSGLDIAVSGSFVFKGNYKHQIQKLKKC